MNTKIHDALELAMREHAWQKRTIGNTVVPYVLHPLEVYSLLKRHDIFSWEILSAAILHDVLEDSEDKERAAKAIQEISPIVYSIVLELTLPETSASKVNPDVSAKYEHIRRLFQSGSYQAKVIKIADRICNVRDFILSGKRDYASKYIKMFDAVMAPYVMNNHDFLSDRSAKELVTEYNGLVFDLSGDLNYN